jgi:hypothetical protein
MPEGIPHNDRFIIERHMVRSGGYMKGHGNGFKYHFKAAMRALMPWFEWHRWSELLIDSFCDYTEIGVMGPASSGKTYCAAAFAYTYFQCFHQEASIIMSTTTRDGLQLRVFGAVKNIHRKAKERRPWLPGRVIDSRSMLTGADSDDETQNFISGILGVACKVGGHFQGISSYVGIKNSRIMLVADEASLMASGFLDSIANLRKGGQWKMIALGNPKDRSDPLGQICEPHISIGGWEGLEFEEKTRTWKTRSDNGLAVQLCGTDSPNYDHPRGLNPHLGLITPEHIESDLAYYGKDSLQYSMMNLGMMPKDGEKRRVVTLTLCDSNNAYAEVVWGNTPVTRVVGVDAAYSAVGGDRSVLTDLGFGMDVTGQLVLAVVEPQIVIPTNAKTTLEVQDQIAEYVKGYCEKRGIPPENVGFDSTGRGTLMSAFSRLWSNAVVPIEFGGPPPPDRYSRPGSEELEKDAYKNMVTALWFASRLVVESKQLRQLSRDCALEGSYREWLIPPGGRKIQVEPKEKTKERMGRSPDLWDSLVTAIEMARRRGFQIAGGAATGYARRKIPQWLLDRQRKVREQERSVALVEA